jgi:hypothetical protein
MSDTSGTRMVEHAKRNGDEVFQSSHNLADQRLTYLVTECGWVDIVRGLGTAKEGYLCGVSPSEFARIAKVSAQRANR